MRVGVPIFEVCRASNHVLDDSRKTRVGIAHGV